MSNDAHIIDEKRRYPIGRREDTGALTQEERERALNGIEVLPHDVRAIARALSERQLDAPYRPGGWTGRQVIHHLADAHAVFFVRFRSVLTGDRAPLLAFDEKTWTQLPDTVSLPVEGSLAMLDGLHQRTVALLRSLPEDAFARTGNHPQHGILSVDNLLWKMAWHGAHHAAHLASLRGAPRKS